MIALQIFLWLSPALAGSEKVAAAVSHPSGPSGLLMLCLYIHPQSTMTPSALLAEWCIMAGK